jgi:hypothetical protein
MNIIGQIKWLCFSYIYPLTNTEFIDGLVVLSGPNAQYSLLFEKFQAFLEVAGEVALTSRCLRDNFESFAISSHCE